MISNKDTETIHSFLFGELSAEEEAFFKLRLKNDSAFKKEYENQKTLQTIIRKLNRKKIINKTLAKISAYKKEKEYNPFAPYKIYEDAIRKNMRLRSGVVKSANNKKFQIQIISPEDEYNVTDETLTFRLKGSLDVDLSLVITNNKDEELFEQTIPPGVTEFDINLNDFKYSKPGRYYWKMKPKNRKEQKKYDLIIRVFFINKEV